MSGSLKDIVRKRLHLRGGEPSIKEWYRDYCQLRVAPRRGTKEEYLDCRRGSACLSRVKFFRDSFKIAKKTGRFIFVDLEPRDSGKSVCAEAEALYQICLNKETTVFYFGEASKPVVKRLMWIRWHLRGPAAKKIIKRYGTFYEDHDETPWDKEAIWVKRPSGPGENPTFRIGSPKMAMTGYRYSLGVLEDVVGRISNATSGSRQELIDCWAEYKRLRAPSGIIWLIGTAWPHYNLIKHIMIHEADNIVARVVPAHGPAHDRFEDDPEAKVIFGKPGQWHYPWVDEERLIQEGGKFYMDNVGVLAHYFNRRVATEYVGWSPRIVRNGTPPWDEHNDEVDRSKVHIYIVTDFAGGKDRKASKNAILVGAADKGRRFILDGWVAKAPLGVAAQEFMRLYTKWWPRWYTYETTGPGAAFPSIVDPMAEKEGIRLRSRPISRWGAEKISRIETVFPAMKSGELVFCRKTLPPRLCDWDEMGQPTGIIPRSMQAFSADPEESKFDALDAIADLIGKARSGRYICPKMGREEEELPEEPLDDPRKAAKRRIMARGRQDWFPFPVDGRLWRG